MAAVLQPPGTPRPRPAPTQQSTLPIQIQLTGVEAPPGTPGQTVSWLIVVQAGEQGRVYEAQNLTTAMLSTYLQELLADY